MLKEFIFYFFSFCLARLIVPQEHFKINILIFFKKYVILLVMTNESLLMEKWCFRSRISTSDTNRAKIEENDKEINHAGIKSIDCNILKSTQSSIQKAVRVKC